MTPPLAFRVSSRPTNVSAYRSKDRQLPRPIPKPFAVKPTLTGASVTRTSFSPFTGNSVDHIIPPPPPLLQSSESSSCSPPPPPLLYIPAAAQRVTHLHGPPTLQRFPSTSPTRDQGNDSHAELPPKVSIIQDEGPPPLKRFPPVVIDLEATNNNNRSTEESEKNSLIGEDNSSESQPRSLWARNKNESKAGATAVNTERSSTSLCDLTKISDVEAGVNRTTSPWSSKEMPLLRRHSSASQYSDAPAAETTLRISREINCSSSPPRLQRVAIPVDSGSRTPPGRVEPSCARGETSRSHLESSSGRFPSHPPILVRHSASYLEESVGATSLQKDAVTPGIDSKRRHPSPFGDLTSSRHESAQSFQERSCARPIPVAGPQASSRHSPLFMSNKEKYRSTYVFSNRQKFPQAENEPRPVQISSLVIPNNNGVSMALNRSEVNLMSFRSSVDGFGRSDERQLPRSMYSQYARPSSSSYIHGAHDKLSSAVNTEVMSANRHFNNSPMGFKRIPSPRSELFSSFSPESVNTTCIPHVDATSRGSLPSGNQQTTFRSAFGQNENATHSLPPTWSHLESPYSIPSAASRNSPPKPYTFSVNFSQSARQSGAYSVSHSNSKARTLEGYSLGPMGSSDGQQVSVIQRTTVSKGEPLNSVQREFCVGEQENYRTFHLPTAFQGRDSRPESSSKVLSNEGSSGSEHSHVMQPYLNDHSTANVIRETSSPLARHASPEKPSPSNSPSLKGTKNKVSDSTVTGSINVRPNSSPKIVKKTEGPKRKETICPSLEKTNDSPVFHPSEEEFRDPAAYIKRIRCDAEKFGVCVIVPPESWKVCNSFAYSVLLVRGTVTSRLARKTPVREILARNSGRGLCVVFLGATHLILTEPFSI